MRGRLGGLLLRRYVDPLIALGIVRMFNDARWKPALGGSGVERIVNDIAGRQAERRKESGHE